LHGGGGNIFAPADDRLGPAQGAEFFTQGEGFIEPQAARDPAVNGPYGGTIRVLRVAGAPTSYKREPEIAPSMRAITPEQVWAALEPQL